MLSPPGLSSSRCRYLLPRLVLQVYGCSRFPTGGFQTHFRGETINWQFSGVICQVLGVIC